MRKKAEMKLLAQSLSSCSHDNISENGPTRAQVWKTEVSLKTEITFFSAHTCDPQLQNQIFDNFIFTTK